MVDNREWLARYGLIEFLRDIGKHFSVPYMLAKDSVQQRLAAGMSFTEFSYMTLQAADFLHLYRERGVEMQMGGADQWGNITAGLELIRRVVGREEGEEPAGVRSVLAAAADPRRAEDGQVREGRRLPRPGADLARSTSTSTGSTTRTSSSMQHLRWLTLLSADEIYEIEEAQRDAPEKRVAQRALAFDLTARVHGRAEAERQVKVADAVFGGAALRDTDVLEVLFKELPSWEFSDGDVADALAAAVAAGLYPSRSEARRQIAQGAFSINDERIVEGARVPDPIAGRYLVLRAGKKRLVIGRRRA